MASFETQMVIVSLTMITELALTAGPVEPSNATTKDRRTRDQSRIILQAIIQRVELSTAHLIITPARLLTDPLLARATLCMMITLAHAFAQLVHQLNLIALEIMDLMLNYASALAAITGSLLMHALQVKSRI
jgi:hypothetical protein